MVLQMLAQRKLAGVCHHCAETRGRLRVPALSSGRASAGRYDVTALKFLRWPFPAKPAAMLEDLRYLHRPTWVSCPERRLRLFALWQRRALLRIAPTLCA